MMTPSPVSTRDTACFIFARMSSTGVPGSMLQVATAGSFPTICSAVETSSSAKRPCDATTRPTMFTPDQPPGDRVLRLNTKLRNSGESFRPVPWISSHVLSRKVRRHCFPCPKFRVRPRARLSPAGRGSAFASPTNMRCGEGGGDAARPQEPLTCPSQPRAAREQAPHPAGGLVRKLAPPLGAWLTAAPRARRAPTSGDAGGLRGEAEAAESRGCAAGRDVDGSGQPAGALARPRRAEGARRLLLPQGRLAGLYRAGVRTEGPVRGLRRGGRGSRRHQR